MSPEDVEIMALVMARADGHPDPEDYATGVREHYAAELRHRAEAAGKPKEATDGDHQ